MRQVQAPIQEGVPLRPDIGQEDPHLTVLGLARRPGVLPLHPDRLGAFLEEARLVHDEDAIGIPERLRDEANQLIPNRVRIPARGVQQPLHALWIGLPDRLGQLPAVLALDWPEQPTQVASTALPDLPPIEEGGEADMERRERFVPRVGAARPLLDQLHGRAGSPAHPFRSSEAVVLAGPCGTQDRARG